MRDMPMFTTSNGVASLILREIPYKKIAYIRIQETLEPKELLCECCDFCKAVGAEHIYATGHSALEAFSPYTQIWEMRCLRQSLPDTDAALFPVQQETLEQWRTLYNEKMQAVPNAQHMTVTDAKELLERGNGYFVHRNGNLMGIGIASGDQVEAIVAAFPGAGRDVLCALNHALFGDQVKLEVASENHRAVRFYEKMGFLKSRCIEKWYQVF